MSRPEIILDNSVISTNGSYIFRASSAQEVILIYNITGPVSTSSGVTLQFAVSEVDPLDESTKIGLVKSSQLITTASYGTVANTLLNSMTMLVEWTVTGPAYFSGSNISIFERETSIDVINPAYYSQNTQNSESGFVNGSITTAATTKVAVRKTAYTEQTSNARRSIASANANDTAAGTGARQIQITYYDSNYNGPYYETLTLNGTTGVNTVNTNICFIEQMNVVSVGSGLVNAGIITLYAATAKGGGAIGTIAASDNQTFWCHHYVANNKVCKITSLVVGSSSTTAPGCICHLVKYYAGVHAPELVVTDFIKAAGSSNTVVRGFGSAVTVNGPARILGYTAPETTSSHVTQLSFDFYEE